MDDPTPLVALKRAVEIAGSQSALARRLGVTQAAVWGWIHKIHALPAEYVLRVEAETGISRHELRHDLYPYELAHTRPADVEPEASK